MTEIYSLGPINDKLRRQLDLLVLSKLKSIMRSYDDDMVVKFMRYPSIVHNL